MRKVDFGRLTRGVLHSKFWIVDRKHVFIGSANMDWRALTQVKSLLAKYLMNLWAHFQSIRLWPPQTFDLNIKKKQIPHKIALIQSVLQLLN